MNTKLLNSLLIIAMAACLAGATYAHFSDTEVSTGNTFASGTLDLKIKDQDENNYKDGVSETWTMSDMKPGDSVSGWVRLRNDGSITADHLEINVTNTMIDPDGPESDSEENTVDMDWEMILVKMDYEYRTTVKNLLDDLDDANKNGYKDLDDLETLGIDNLLAPTYHTTRTFNITLQFNPDADNDFQGDTLISTFNFTLNQHESQ
jgi:predicted ribosomally synthesized peptide with SipW-like signal peptide